jgi:hypothetical protein
MLSTTPWPQLARFARWLGYSVGKCACPRCRQQLIEALSRDRRLT